jgi:hypothetical protein
MNTAQNYHSNPGQLRRQQHSVNQSNQPTKEFNMAKLIGSDKDDKNDKPKRDKGANAGVPASRDISKDVEKAHRQRQNPSR